MREPPDFIGQLCVALAHRWEPNRLFMIFTAYLDESGTHADSPVCVMGGILGNAAQWRKTSGAITRLQKKHKFSILHTKDLISRRGEFENWSDRQIFSLVRDVSDVVSKNLMVGLSFEFQRNKYDSIFNVRNTKDDLKKVPRWVRFDNYYGFLFRLLVERCMLSVINSQGHRGDFPADTHLHVVLEAGHPNSGECCRIFQDMSKQYARNELPILASFTVVPKGQAPELMFADLTATTQYLVRTGRLPGVPPGAIPPFKTGGANLIHISVDELGWEALRNDHLRQIREQRWSSKKEKLTSNEALTDAVNRPAPTSE